MATLLEQGAYFGVRHLWEIEVPFANRIKQRRRGQANTLVDLPAQYF